MTVVCGSSRTSPAARSSGLRCRAHSGPQWEPRAMVMMSQPETEGAVHIIDDDDAVRRAVALLLQSAGWSTVTHVSGLAFVDMLPTLDEASIGCVLTDMRMPGMDGITL